MPLLPLDTWRQITGYHPLHFWGVYDQQKAPVQSACNDLVRQYDWQAAQRIGRRDLESHLDQAAAILATYLRYSVGARPVTWTNVPVQRDRIILPEGYIQALGREVLALVGTPAVALTDADNDGLQDTATIIITLASASDEIVVMFSPADRIAGQRDDWRVQPATITIAGLVATITVPSRTVVKPVLYESLLTQPGNGLLCNAVSNYVETLAVYSRTVDATAAVTINGVATSATICDAVHGVLTLNTVCQPCQSCTTSPCTHTNATVQAIAGLPLENGLPILYWRRVLAQFAAALIPGMLCECAKADSFLHIWQQDVSRIGNAQEEFAFKEQAINNPLGPRRGAIAAWQAIKTPAHTRGYRF